MGAILYGGAIHIREQAKIDAARITQKSGNERRAAESELTRFSQALGNKRAMDAAGKNINAITENIGRNLDAATTGDFMQQVAAAEELGAMAAMAASAGVGGSSVEAYNETIRLSVAMQKEQGDRALRTDLINASASRGDVLTDTVATFDSNVYRADLDFTQYVDHKKPSFLGNLLTLGLAAGATALAGPQAGMAVIGMREAKIAADNGDFASASASAMGAISNGVGAAKATHSMGGNYWSSAKSKMSGITFGEHDIIPSNRMPPNIFTAPIRFK